jgi:hypothetical protein
MGQGAGSGEGVGQWPVENRAIDSQHGTRVEGRSHLCTEGYHRKQVFFCIWKPHLLITVHGIMSYNSTRRSYGNMHLFLGLLALLQTIMYSFTLNTLLLFPTEDVKLFLRLS